MLKNDSLLLYEIIHSLLSLYKSNPALFLDHSSHDSITSILSDTSSPSQHWDENAVSHLSVDQLHSLHTEQIEPIHISHPKTRTDTLPHDPNSLNQDERMDILKTESMQTVYRYVLKSVYDRIFSTHAEEQYNNLLISNPFDELFYGNTHIQECLYGVEAFRRDQTHLDSLKHDLGQSSESSPRSALSELHLLRNERPDLYQKVVENAQLDASQNILHANDWIHHNAPQIQELLNSAIEHINAQRYAFVVKQILMSIGETELSRVFAEMQDTTLSHDSSAEWMAELPIHISNTSSENNDITTYLEAFCQAKNHESPAEKSPTLRLSLHANLIRKNLLVLHPLLHSYAHYLHLHHHYPLPVPMFRYLTKMKQIEAHCKELSSQYLSLYTSLVWIGCLLREPRLITRSMSQVAHLLQYPLKKRAAGEWPLNLVSDWTAEFVQHQSSSSINILHFSDWSVHIAQQALLFYTQQLSDSRHRMHMQHLILIHSRKHAHRGSLPVQMRKLLTRYSRQQQKLLTVIVSGLKSISKESLHSPILREAVCALKRVHNDLYCLHLAERCMPLFFATLRSQKMYRHILASIADTFPMQNSPVNVDASAYTTEVDEYMQQLQLAKQMVTSTTTNPVNDFPLPGSDQIHVTVPTDNPFEEHLEIRHQENWYDAELHRVLQQSLLERLEANPLIQMQQRIAQEKAEDAQSLALIHHLPTARFGANGLHQAHAAYNEAYEALSNNFADWAMDHVSLTPIETTAQIDENEKRPQNPLLMLRKSFPDLCIIPPRQKVLTEIIEHHLLECVHYLFTRVIFANLISHVAGALQSGMEGLSMFSAHQVASVATREYLQELYQFSSLSAGEYSLKYLETPRVLSTAKEGICPPDTQMHILPPDPLTPRLIKIESMRDLISRAYSEVNWRKCAQYLWDTYSDNSPSETSRASNALLQDLCLVVSNGKLEHVFAASKLLRIETPRALPPIVQLDALKMLFESKPKGGTQKAPDGNATLQDEFTKWMQVVSENLV